MWDQGGIGRTPGQGLEAVVVLDMGDRRRIKFIMFVKDFGMVGSFKGSKT